MSRRLPLHRRDTEEAPASRRCRASRPRVSDAAMLGLASGALWLAWNCRVHVLGWEKR